MFLTGATNSCSYVIVTTPLLACVYVFVCKCVCVCVSRRICQWVPAPRLPLVPRSLWSWQSYYESINTTWRVLFGVPVPWGALYHGNFNFYRSFPLFFFLLYRTYHITCCLRSWSTWHVYYRHYSYFTCTVQRGLWQIWRGGFRVCVYLFGWFYQI